MSNRTKQATLGRIGKACVVVILLMSIALIAKAESAVIVLKEAVTINTAVIHLRDIVAPDAIREIKADLLNAELCKAPQPGRRRHLSRSFIVMKLKNKEKDTQSLSFDGARGVDVTRCASVLSLLEVENAVKDNICGQYGLDKKNIRITFENMSKDIVLPDENFCLSIEEASSGFRNGRYRVYLIIQFKNGYKQKKFISAKVEEKQKVVCSSAFIKTGEILKEEDLLLCERFVNPSDSFFTVCENVSGKEARIDIAEGEQVHPRMIVERPVVARGAYVEAVIKKTGMNVTLGLTMLEAAKEGHVARAYSSSLQKQFKVKVISQDRVEVVG